MSKRWRGLGPMSSEAMQGNAVGRFQTRTGHVCVLCGFIPTTKNKYRELQDHLVRVHFRDAIKAALPTRRPYLCPEKACNVEGKDWQALMRHYTGKHGVLDAYLKEALANNGNITIDPETTVTATALRPEDLFLAENIIHHHEVIDGSQGIPQNQSQVEVVTSFELPSMMGGQHQALEHTHDHLGAYTEMEEHPELQYQEVAEELDKRKSDSEAAQINTVSSTIQFPTTIPLMLGATATKRAKTEPEVLINNGGDSDSYAFVDLKYFLADPSKVMALPYKIILPQMEEDDIKQSSEEVQVNMLAGQELRAISVETQTDPWTVSCDSCLHKPLLTESASQTTVKEECQLIDNNHNAMSDVKTVKELDFAYF